MKNSATICFNIDVKCDSKCDECKYLLVPSECEPWDKAISDFTKSTNLNWRMLQKIDSQFVK